MESGDEDNFSYYTVYAKKGQYFYIPKLLYESISYSAKVANLELSNNVLRYNAIVFVAEAGEFLIRVRMICEKIWKDPKLRPNVAYDEENMLLVVSTEIGMKLIISRWYIEYGEPMYGRTFNFRTSAVPITSDQELFIKCFYYHEELFKWNSTPDFLLT